MLLLLEIKSSQVIISAKTIIDTTAIATVVESTPNSLLKNPKN